MNHKMVRRILGSVLLILAGLMILSELHLIEYKPAPLEWRILPSGKVSLENSRFRARLMQMKGEGRKTI